MLAQSHPPRAPRVIGTIGLVLALCVVPPVAARVFALSPLHAADRTPLWCLAAALALGGLALGWWPGAGKGRTRVAALLLPLFALLGIELAVRLWVKTDQPQRDRLIDLADRTYPEEMTFEPHPFLQFTPRPGVTHKLDRVDREGGFNSQGFLGPEVTVEKPAGALRVVCLGGSTTATGYPKVMREWLQRQDGVPSVVEVLNFGVARYQSTHSVVNFVLNAVDFEPDYVVFHHAWNDHWSRDREGPIRGDGFNYMREFRYPEIPDALLIRGSVIYRHFQALWQPQAVWMFLTNALMPKVPTVEGPRYRNLAELAPYERNVRTVVELALVRGMVPVLVTMPHTTDPEMKNFYIAEHIDQCNAIVRRLAEEFGDRLVLVDLDRQVTGVHEEFFRDLGHMTPAGIDFKAQAIGAAILEHRRAHR